MTQPYTPLPAPIYQNPDDEGLRILARYCTEELQNVARAIRYSTVQQSYGGMYETGLIPSIPATPSWRIIGGFTEQQPQQPFGVEVDLAQDNLTIREQGVYAIQFQVAAEVSSGVTYVVAVFADNTETPIQAIVDPSNQTDYVTWNGSGVFGVDRGGVLDLRVRTLAGSGTFDPLNMFFHVFRVSELHDALR